MIVWDLKRNSRSSNICSSNIYNNVDTIRATVTTSLSVIISCLVDTPILYYTYTPTIYLVYIWYGDTEGLIVAASKK